MKVTIIPDDKAVYVDGQHVHVANFEELGIAPNVHSVQWDSGLKRGEVAYKPLPHTVLDEVQFEAMFGHVVAHHKNLSAELEAKRVAFEMADKAHTERAAAKAVAEEKRALSTQDKLVQQSSDIEALKAQIIALSAALKTAG